MQSVKTYFKYKKLMVLLTAYIIRRSDVLPLRRVSFLEVSLPIPKNVSAVLKAAYGEDVVKGIKKES